MRQQRGEVLRIEIEKKRKKKGRGGISYEPVMAGSGWLLCRCRFPSGRWVDAEVGGGVVLCIRSQGAEMMYDMNDILYTTGRHFDAAVGVTA